MLPLAYQTVLDDRTRIIFCRRQVCSPWNKYSGSLLEEIVPDFRFQEIHVSLIIGIYRGNIAPVVFYLITVDLLQILVTDQDIR